MHVISRRQKGFTLIELMVAIGLFAVVMTLATGAYLTMINVNRRAQALATGVDSLSFSIETMTREIRTGSSYACTNGQPVCTSFSFVDTARETVTYSLNAGAKTLTRTTPTSSYTLNDPTVAQITTFFVYLYGPASYSASGNTDTEQARVHILLTARVLADAGQYKTFTIETAATMRGSDL